MNIVAVLVAALIPLMVGFVWYNPKVFGTVWMRSIGVNSEEEMKAGANMAVIFGVSLIFAFLLSLSLYPMVIHQSGIFSLIADMPEAKDAKIEILINGAPLAWENKFRTFGHGAFHGALFGIFLVLPVLGTNALFERRGFKYIAINVGYWLVSMMLMGGLICAWK